MRRVAVVVFSDLHTPEFRLKTTVKFVRLGSMMDEWKVGYMEDIECSAKEWDSPDPLVYP